MNTSDLEVIQRPRVTRMSSATGLSVGEGVVRTRAYVGENCSTLIIQAGASLAVSMCRLRRPSMTSRWTGGLGQQIASASSLSIRYLGTPSSSR